MFVTFPTREPSKYTFQFSWPRKTEEKYYLYPVNWVLEDCGGSLGGSKKKREREKKEKEV